MYHQPRTAGEKRAGKCKSSKWRLDVLGSRPNLYVHLLRKVGVRAKEGLKSRPESWGTFGKSLLAVAQIKGHYLETHSRRAGSRPPQLLGLIKPSLWKLAVISHTFKSGNSCISWGFIKYSRCRVPVKTEGYERLISESTDVQNSQENYSLGATEIHSSL